MDQCKSFRFFVSKTENSVPLIYLQPDTEYNNLVLANMLVECLLVHGNTRDIN